MADALAAVTALEAAGKPEIIDDILSILGLDAVKGQPDAVPQRRSPQRSRTAAPAGGRDTDARSEGEPETAVTPTDGSAIIQPLPPEPPPALELEEETLPLEWMSDRERSEQYWPPVAAQLIRAGITALARRARSTRRPDIGALVARVASAVPVTAVPMLVETSLADGIVVFADRGAEMEPYRQDVRYLVERVQGTVGAAHTRVVWLPRDDEPDENRATQVPLPDRPALVISALGLPETASIDPDSALFWADLLDWLDGSPHGYTVLTPHAGAVAMLTGAGRQAVTWDGLAATGRRRA